MTVTTELRAAPAAGSHRDDFVNVLRAELCKLRTVRSTYAAVLAALAAKGLVLTAVTLATATASTFAAYLAFQAALPARTLAGTALSDPGIVRAVAGGGLYIPMEAGRSTSPSIATRPRLARGPGSARVLPLCRRGDPRRALSSPGAVMRDRRHR